MGYEVYGKKYNNIWVTSDLHFGHKNVIKFCPTTRPYTDSIHMNNSIRDHWNSKVGDDDLVIIVGDLSFMGITQTVDIMKSLKGSKGLFVGNHDRALIENPIFRKLFVFTKDIDSVVIDNQKYVFCHFPIFEWDSMQRGSMHIHGHCHGNLDSNRIGGRIIDIGWDAQSTILNLQDVKKFLLKKPIRSH